MADTQPNASAPAASASSPPGGGGQFVWPAGPPWWSKPPKKGFFRRIPGLLGFLLFVGSLAINGILLGVVGSQMQGPFEKTVLRPGQAEQVVAVYEVRGVIDDRAAARLRRFAELVEQDKNVRAVVLRVDSPGGGVSASDQMHQTVQALRKGGRRVVVSMGGVAASGGYYVSAGADEIVAEETTVTGSIGVLAMWVMLKGTLEKIGAEAVILRSTHARAWKAGQNPIEKLQPRHQQELQKLLDTMQDRFEQVVRDGRGDKLPANVRQDTPLLPVADEIKVVQAGQEQKVTTLPPDPFNGKVYVAGKANELGLVDAIGYESDAIDRAASLAGLSDPHVVRFQPRPQLFAQFLGALDGGSALAEGAEALQEWRTPRLMMLWTME